MIGVDNNYVGFDYIKIIFLFKLSLILKDLDYVERN